jgi:hypothetical protein
MFLEFPRILFFQEDIFRKSDNARRFESYLQIRLIPVINTYHYAVKENFTIIQEHEVLLKTLIKEFHLKAQ